MTGVRGPYPAPSKGDVKRFANRRRSRLKELEFTLRPFARGAAIIEKALGPQTHDGYVVRRGAQITLGDLRQARRLLREIERIMAGFDEPT